MPIQLQFRLPVALHNRLRRLAYQERRSLAAVTRLLIEEGLQARSVRRRAGGAIDQGSTQAAAL
jgi:hypothetical protein